MTKFSIPSALVGTAVAVVAVAESARGSVSPPVEVQPEIAGHVLESHGIAGVLEADAASVFVALPNGQSSNHTVFAGSRFIINPANVSVVRIQNYDKVTKQ